MKTIRICKERYCSKEDSEKLIEFAKNKTQSDSDIEVVSSGCLGACDYAPSLEVKDSQTERRKRHFKVTKGYLMSLIKKLRMK